MTDAIRARLYRMPADPRGRALCALLDECDSEDIEAAAANEHGYLTTEHVRRVIGEQMGVDHACD